MGAEMIMGVISYKKREGEEKGTYGSEFQRRVEAVMKACEEAKDFDQQAVLDYFETIYGKTPEDATTLQPFGNCLEEVRDEFKKVISDFGNCLGHRDVDTLDYPERLIIFSGGMSFGEEPTDSYTIINKFSMLPLALLQAGGFD